MFQMKYMLFAAIALMAVDSTIAIIGGQDAERSQFPYFAYLKTHRGKYDYWTGEMTIVRFECGGALISNQYVATAASCLVNTEGAQVHLGLVNLNDAEKDGRESFNVTQNDYLIYPTYDKNIPSINDIALVKLPSPVWFSQHIHTIPFACLPSDTATNVITMGFGRTADKKFAKTLQHTKFQTVELQRCIADTRHLISKNSVVCAIGAQSSICHGDLGGPLVSARSGKLIGVAAYIDKNCEVGRRQGFTGVAAYMQWIEGVIEGVLCTKE